jgi:hypothetical protein
MASMVLPMPVAAAPAAALPDICGAIARIQAAARERPAFRSLRRALVEERAVVPGFEAAECSVTADGIECRGRRSASAFRNWPDLATCRGVAGFEPPLPRPRVRYPSNRSYRLGRFLIARGVRCPGCAALGPSFFTMTFYRPLGRRP